MLGSVSGFIHQSGSGVEQGPGAEFCKQKKPKLAAYISSQEENKLNKKLKRDWKGKAGGHVSENNNIDI